MASNDANYVPLPTADRVMDRILHPTEDTDYRVPFIFTSDFRINAGVPPIRMKMNPTSVQITQGKRITRKDTQAGAVFFHWTDARGRNNDVINLSFSGSTGNINLRTGMQRDSVFSDQLKNFRDKLNAKTRQDVQGDLDVESFAGASKLANFWNLYSLTSEPMLNPNTGDINRFYFIFSSPLLGNTMVQFIGHFDKVLEFTDTADSPFSKDYSFSFVATETVPSMDMMYRYVSTALGQEFFNELV